MLNLKNKKILVLGASGNLGREVAIALSKLGAKLVASGRDEVKLSETMSLLCGDEHRSVVFDICKLDEIKDFMQDIVAFDGQKLYGLVYCSGVIPVRPIKSTSYDFLHDTMMVNYYGFVESVRQFSNKKICDGGSVVALSSYASLNPDRGQLAYGASKAAMDNSVVVMAKEFYQKNIRINSIRPAIISYEGIEQSKLSLQTNSLIEQMGTGAIEPENIAKQVAFLLSEASSGVYGRCFDVRGYLS